MRETQGKILASTAEYLRTADLEELEGIDHHARYESLMAPGELSMPWKRAQKPEQLASQPHRCGQAAGGSLHRT